MAGVPQDLQKKSKVTGGLTAIAHSSDRSCRICLEEEETKQNPFITPCKCIGSVRFIHLDCFKSWLGSKKLVNYNDGVTSFFWEDLKCDLCKSSLNLSKITMGD